MSTPVERPAFHYGQVLTSEDLNALTKYVRDKDLQAARRHAWGVVEGLEVRAAGNDHVEVQVGSAVTAAGHDIVVTKAFKVDLRKAKLPRDLVLRYVEEPTRPVSAEQPPGDPCGQTSGQKPGSHHSRIGEKYKEETLEPNPGDPELTDVPLARLSRTGTGIEINPFIRRYFGAEVRNDPDGKLLIGKVLGIDVLEATALLTRWGVVVSEWSEEQPDLPPVEPPRVVRGELVRLVSDRKTRRVLRIESCEVWT
ncbi:MAG: hypothetical protein HOV94_24055 [Saccharothrix sp.]|nr:hypothetical protein [Saccharothrix sp.]